MTRFARAKGSKASNERAPEDATPWAVMKEQLQRAKDDAEHARLREQAEKQRLENYEKFLNEQKSAKRKSTWCEFPDERPEQLAKQRKKSQHPAENETPTESLVKNKKKKKNMIDASHNKNYDQSTDTINSSETVTLNKKMKKKLLKQNTDSENAESAQVEKLNKTSKKKKKKSIKDSAENEQSKEVNPELNETENDIAQKEKKNKKRKNKTNNQIDPSLQADSELSHARQENSDFEKGKSSSRNTIETVSKLSPAKQKKKNKFDKGTHKRRKTEDDRSFQLIINGRAVELVRFDGFPVMRKDADRLEELKRSMMTKGIPKSEVQRTMKLERRRAEKALARLKRDVCYNCRKGGHNLSDCPELRDKLEPRGAAEAGTAGLEGVADGVCFKCGSTEHRAFDCKVQRSQEYKFASCFICKEQGHIARQCPDNPRGLYPNGGACKLCGDVTHMRKDCPTTSTEKVEASVRLETLASSDAVEEISERATNTASAGTTNKKTKKIKF